MVPGDSTSEPPSPYAAPPAADVARWLREGFDVHAIFAITDDSGVIVFVNDQFCAISGYTREELLGHTHRIVKSGEHDAAFYATMWQTLRAGRIWRGTICNRAKSGALYWVESTLMPVGGEEGAPRYFVALRTDVTALKQAEFTVAQRTHDLELRVAELEEARRGHAETTAQLQLAHEQVRVFFDHAPIGISWVEWGRFGARDVYHLNHRFCQIIGLSREEAQNFDNISAATHPDDRHEQAALMARVHSGELENFTLEKRYHHRDGHTVWGSLTVAVLRAPDGRITHQFAMLQDITERRRAEEELRAALQRREELERIVNRSPSVVVLWRAEEGWPVEYVSQSIRQFGHAPEEFTGRRLSFRDITHPEDLDRVNAEVAAHAARGHREYNQEYRIVCTDGAVRWVDDHTVVRFDQAGKVTHHEGLITDITVRHEAEERERRLRERDLRLAGEVQDHLRPHLFPDIGAVEIEALSVPTTHIGGDYYDVLPVDARRWGFVIADVAGKGAPAALMMAACRATLRLCAAGELSAASVVRRVNQALHDDMPKGMFISLFYGILDLDTNRLRYVRAGHEPALILRRGVPRPELLDAGGMALGFDRGPLFEEMLEEHEVTLAPGDLLALYTDGITEAPDAAGMEFGRDRLADALIDHPERSLSEAVRALNARLKLFAALSARHDDRTLLLVRPR